MDNKHQVCSREEAQKLLADLKAAYQGLNKEDRKAAINHMQILSDKGTQFIDTVAEQVNALHWAQDRN